MWDLGSLFEEQSMYVYVVYNTWIRINIHGYGCSTGLVSVDIVQAEYVGVVASIQASLSWGLRS